MTRYNFLPNFKNGKFIQDYKQLAKDRIQDWHQIGKKGGIPYIPSISTGWDATPRGERVKDISVQTEFPWKPIVVNDTPDNFEYFFKKETEYVENEPHKIVNICSWNEWSEGAYLEPDSKNGFGYLEKVRDFKIASCF